MSSLKTTLLLFGALTNLCLYLNACGRTPGTSFCQFFITWIRPILGSKTGSVGDSFAVHQRKEELMEKVKARRGAVTEVAGLGGMPLLNQVDG